jgi:hypothetical protein
MQKCKKNTHKNAQKRESLSPLPFRCYLQTPVFQVVLQGGNGDKGLKNYV